MSGELYYVRHSLYTDHSRQQLPRSSGLQVLRPLRSCFGSPGSTTGGTRIDDMYSLLKLPYPLASRFATAISAPALEPLAFSFCVPLELGATVVVKVLRVLPVGLFLSRWTAQRSCVWRLHYPRVHFSPRTLTYPEYVASLLQTMSLHGLQWQQWLSCSQGPYI